MNSPRPVVPPFNDEAERSVLGAVLLDERHLATLTVECGLRPDHFYRDSHRHVFQAMLDLYAHASRIDAVTVAERLRETGQLEAVGGPGAVDVLAGWVPAAGNAGHYGRIVRENAQVRELLSKTYEIQASVSTRGASTGELVERAGRAMLEVAQDERRNPVIPIAKTLDGALDLLPRRAAARTRSPEPPPGSRTSTS